MSSLHTVAAAVVRRVGWAVRALVLRVRRQWHLRLQLDPSQSSLLSGTVLLDARAPYRNYRQTKGNWSEINYWNVPVNYMRSIEQSNRLQRTSKRTQNFPVPLFLHSVCRRRSQTTSRTRKGCAGSFSPIQIARAVFCPSIASRAPWKTIASFHFWLPGTLSSSNVLYFSSHSRWKLCSTKAAVRCEPHNNNYRTTVYSSSLFPAYCRYHKLCERLRSEQTPDRMLQAPEFAFRFLNHCRNLMLYGSTFFICRTLARKQQHQAGSGGRASSPTGAAAGPSAGAGGGSGGRKKHQQQPFEVF